MGDIGSLRFECLFFLFKKYFFLFFSSFYDAMGESDKIFILLLFMQFNGFIDLEPYDTIALKLKGDGRCYISTVSLSSFSIMANKS